MNNSFQEALVNQMVSYKTETFEDKINDSKANIIDSIESSEIVNDSYGNKILSVGNDDRIKKYDEYSMDNDTLNYPLWLALYNGSWVFKRAIDKPSQDEIRCGITLKGKSDFTEVYSYINKYTTPMIELLQWGALFGGSVAVLLFDNIPDEEYAKPMNYEKLKQAKAMRIYVTDRWYGVQPSNTNVVDMNSLDFGKPNAYTITMGNGTAIKFHHDYVLRYEHRIAPKLIKNGMLQGWGYAEGSHILDCLMQDDKLKNSIQSLVDKALLEVIKMAGMRGVFMGSDTENQEQLTKRLEMVNWGRNFNSLTFLDKDDEYEAHGFQGLTGLSEILSQNMWQIAAALEMQGILFGDLKGGFSQDTEALIRYSETIKNRCELYVRPVYEKFLSIIYKIKGINEKVDFTFNAAAQRTEQDEYAKSLKNIADLLSQMLQDGVITQVQYAKAIQKFASDGILDLGIDDDYINKLKEEESLEKEDINLENIDMENK